MIGEGCEQRIEGGRLRALGPKLILQPKQNGAIFSIIRQRLATVPGEVADMEELDPREKEIDPIAEICRKLDLRALELIATTYLDEGSIEKSRVRTIQKDEIEGFWSRSTPVKLEKRKVQSGKPHMGKHGKGRALGVWLAHEAETGILGLIGEDTGIGGDESAIRILPVLLRSIISMDDSAASGKQIALASFGQATQIG